MDLSVPGFRLLRPLDGSALQLAETEAGDAAVLRLQKGERPELEEALERWQAWGRVADEEPDLLVRHLGSGWLDAGTIFLASAYHPRGSLAAELARTRRLPEALALRHTLRAARALEGLHARGLVHGGLRPSRLLLGAEGARLLGGCPQEAAPEHRLFRAPEFDPELARGPRTGQAFDIYALGALLYACLTGQAPEPGFPDLFELERLAVRRPVQDLIDLLLDPDPAHRLGSAAAAVRELTGLLPDEAATTEATVSGPTAAAEEEPRPRCGSYVLLDELARGGMGVVYRARHAVLGTDYAVKRLMFGKGADPSALRRFMREARTLARLRHPDIITVHEVGFAEDTPYLVMDLVEGGSLADLLREEERLEPRRAATLLCRVARAVDYFHGQGIVHRDLKPANILLEADQQPRVGDFGIAADLHSEEELTRSGAVLGTPSYMAPEQVGGRGEVGPAADIYALGAILYRTLTGRPPHTADSRIGLLRAISDELPIAPARLRPELSRSLSAIAERALAKDPARRYPSAAALAADLQRYLDGQSVLARPVTFAERSLLWVQRHPLLSASLATVLLLAVGLVGLFLDSAARVRRERARQLEGQGLELLGRDADAARSALEAALALEPELFAAQRALGRLLLAEDQPRAALAWLERAAAQVPDAEVFSLLGRACRQLDRPEAARQAFRDALEHGSQRFADRLQLAALLFEAAAAEEALALLGELPDDARLAGLRLRAACNRALGRHHAEERDRWALCAEAPADTAGLPPLVERRLLALDALSLREMWRELQWRILPERARALAVIQRHEEAALVRQAGDPTCALPLRLRSVLELCQFPRFQTERSLRDLREESTPPVLRAAAWSTSLAIDQGAPQADWVEEARRASGLGAALAALTLAEQSARLPSWEPALLTRLASAESWQLRGGLALAVATAVALEPGFEAAALELLAHLFAAEADPRVRTLAQEAEGALRLLAGGEAPALSSSGLRLAFALARQPVRERPARLERCHAALRERLAEDPDAALLVLAAREAVEAGDFGGALEAATRACALAPDGLEARGLEALLRLQTGDARALEALAELDPETARRARRRAEVVEALGLVPLAGPGGQDILCLDLARGAAPLLASFELHSLRDEGWEAGAYRFGARSELHSRMVFLDLSEVAVEASGELEIKLDADRFLASNISLFRDLNVDDRFVRRFGGARSHSRLVHVRYDRLELRQVENGRLYVHADPVARMAQGGGRVQLTVWSPGALRRLRLVGRLAPRAPDLPPDFAPFAGAEPRRGPITEPSPTLGNRALPASLEALWRDGLRLPVRNFWIREDYKESPIFVVASLDGDFDFRARVELEPEARVYAGVAVKTSQNYHDAVRLELHGPTATNFLPFAASLSVQAARRWESKFQEQPWDGRPCFLALRRRGDWFQGFAGPTPESLEPVGPPFHFPLTDPVDVCLYTRTTLSGAIAQEPLFDTVELRLPER